MKQRSIRVTSAQGYWVRVRLGEPPRLRVSVPHGGKPDWVRASAAPTPVPEFREAGESLGEYYYRRTWLVDAFELPET